MFYNSTRNKELRISAAEAIVKGISEDGGLFLPISMPKVDEKFIEGLQKKPYIERAADILSLFLEDFSYEEILNYAKGAYGGEKFSSPAVAPLVSVGEKFHILELWHGPTCAFKDMALQILPYLLTGSAKKVHNEKKIIILVATSGDTGKAALEGFRDVDGTGILVFYPVDGVSPMQKLQMVTQKGENVGVCAIYGNFDDAQNAVKSIFTDETVKAKLAENGFAFSSANSINWGRLAPQIVYYFSAYADLLQKKKIKNGEKINIVVPTGNFGNILAAYYAKQMGLPVKKLICASNANHILTDFIKTGVYDVNREFTTTISPSMDILISSNLERLLFLLSDSDDAAIRAWYQSQKETGKFEVGEEMREKISQSFAAGYCDDCRTKKTIGEMFKKYGYLCDTHTAVAIRVYEDYLETTGDDTPCVIASTANPYKFSAGVLSSIQGEIPLPADEFEQVSELESVTGVKAPNQLRSLKDEKPRFQDVCKKEDMIEKVYKMLGIE